MAEFRSWYDYPNFYSRCKYGARYILDEQAQDFLSALVSTSEARKLDLPKGIALWRCQLGPAEFREVETSNGRVPDAIEVIPQPWPPERMKPPVNKASEGRANPKGIAYLYLSTDRDTAIAEVRPWEGSWISVGLFQTTRDLVLVDCSRDEYTGVTEDELARSQHDAAAREELIWREINGGFSEPVTPTDNTPDYVPTQVIAECFRFNDFDGIQYSSALGKGQNIVLFDLGAAELARCQIYAVGVVEFSSRPIEGLEYVTPYGEDHGASGST